MTHIATRDAFGLHRVVYALDDLTHAPSLRALLAKRPDLARDVDAAALNAHLDGHEDRARTVLATARQLLPGHALHDDGTTTPIATSPPPTSTLLRTLLERAVAAAVAVAENSAVALSGGLDSAIVLALARSVKPDIPAYVLAPRFPDRPDYDETAAALRTADALGHKNVVVVAADKGAFQNVAADAVRTFEAPLYNAHPIAKVLLAERLRQDGVARVLSGDGADHVMKRDASADYLPLVQAAHDAAGVALVSPFLDDAVVAHLTSLPPDPDKRALRDVAAALGVPPPLVRGPKQSSLAPPIGISSLVTPARIEALTTLLTRPAPDLDAADDRTRMLWCTASIIVDAFAVS